MPGFFSLVCVFLLTFIAVLKKKNRVSRIVLCFLTGRKLLESTLTSEKEPWYERIYTEANNDVISRRKTDSLFFRLLCVVGKDNLEYRRETIKETRF